MDIFDARIFVNPYYYWDSQYSKVMNKKSAFTVIVQ